MSFLSDLGWRLRALFFRSRVEREMAEEMAFHLERETEERIRAGASPEAARREARLAFGGTENWKEATRDARGTRYAEDFGRDLRHALRGLRRSPGFTATVVLTLGLGLGAAAAIFTASDAALRRPLPYANPERLVHLWELRAGTEERSPTSYPTLLDWRARGSSFTAFEGYDPANFTIGAGDGARMRRGAQVTAGFFRLLGVPMSAGRDFVQQEEATVGAAVTVVTDDFARSINTGTVLGHTITVNGTPHVIVGVLPNTFHFASLQNVEVFIPLVVNEQRRGDRSQRSIHVVGRLRDDVTLPRAADELASAMAELAHDHPQTLAGRTVRAMPLRDALLGNMKLVLASLLVAVGLLIVIMATNLALLMLSRYMKRAPELALRTTLGATQGGVWRQVLVENLVPTAVGAALAVVIGDAATRTLLAAIPDAVRVSMPYLENAGLVAKSALMITAVAVILVVAFTVWPTLLITNARPRVGDTRATLRRDDRRLRQGLVSAQVALTVTLLIASAFLVASFTNLVRRDLGFRDPETLITARVPLSGPRYDSPTAQRQFYESLLATSAVLPGIQDVALIDEVPGGGGGITTFEPIDRPRLASLRQRVVRRTTGGEYFRTMGIPVTAGRSFDTRDRADSPPVIVISASLGRLLAADGMTVGRRLRLAETGDTEWEVVGVVGDVQATSLDADSPPVVYLSHLQAAENRLMIVLRTALEAAAVTNQLGPIVQHLDAGIPLYAVGRLDQQLGASRAMFIRRFPMILCGVFAVAALALTLIALYAVTLHEVLTRHREFGIRAALGATPSLIRRLILTDALLLSAVGAGVGVAGAILVSHSMEALLFGITAGDWRVYGGVSMIVLSTALLSSFAPALRAAKTDPNTALRAEGT